MPRYDFRCKSCGHTFELSCSVKDSDDVPCAACEAPTEIVIAPVVGRADVRYTCKAIMEDGRRVEGHFGVLEKRRKLGWM